MDAYIRYLHMDATSQLDAILPDLFPMLRGIATGEPQHTHISNCFNCLLNLHAIDFKESKMEIEGTPSCEISMRITCGYG